MKFKVKTEEIWNNVYIVEASDPKEARKKALEGEFCIDYFPTMKNDGKPRAFLDFFKVEDGISE